MPTGEEQGSGEDEVVTEDDGGEAARLKRREAMRRAAGAAAVAGATWSAPRVEGLSILPDYAAAATGTGSFTFLIRTADAAPTYYDSVGDEVPACPGDGGSYFAVRAVDNPGATSVSPGPGNTNGTTRTVTAPIGPAGSATVTVLSGPSNQGEFNDTRSDISVAVNIDPPWNRCRVSSFTATKCNGSGATINQSGNPAPGAQNPAPFNVTFTIPGPQPNYLSHVQIVVSCT